MARRLPILLVLALVAVACSESVNEGSPVLTSPPAPEGPLEGMGAEVTGVVVYDDTTGCVQIELEGTTYPVIWPAGTTWQEEPPAVVLEDGVVVTPGMTVWGGGGYLSQRDIAATAGETTSARAAACIGPTGEIAYFNEGATVEVREG